MKDLSKKQKICYFVIFVLLLIGFIIIGTRDYTIEEMEEQNVFNLEYNMVPSKNVFVYSNSTKIYNALRNNDAIIFFGFSKNEFSGYYAKIINEVSLEIGIKEILYYDFYEDRKNNNGTYESIVLFLQDYLKKNDIGKVDLVAPSMVIIKNGKIIYYDEETAYTYAKMTPSDYWTDYNINLKKATLRYVFNEYLEDNNGK